MRSLALPLPLNYRLARENIQAGFTRDGVTTDARENVRVYAYATRGHPGSLRYAP
jgi:hypothetical protein